MGSFAPSRGSESAIPVLREPIQVPAKAEKMCDLAVQLGNFGTQQTADAKAGRISPVARSKDSLHFWKGEPYAQSALNELDALL